MTYPTWRTINGNHTASMEQIDGMPDWQLVRDIKTKLWHATGRTSAHWLDKTFLTLADAKRHVEKECARR